MLSFAGDKRPCLLGDSDPIGERSLDFHSTWGRAREQPWGLGKPRVKIKVGYLDEVTLEVSSSGLRSFHEGPPMQNPSQKHLDNREQVHCRKQL